MPIYEYEYLDENGEFTGERFETMQAVGEESLTVCPDSGRRVKRVVSQASFALGKDVSPEKAAEKGFTTYRKTGKGEYEKLAGQGADAIVDKSSPDPPKPKVYDLDSP